MVGADTNKQVVPVVSLICWPVAWATRTRNLPWKLRTTLQAP